MSIKVIFKIVFASLIIVVFSLVSVQTAANDLPFKSVVNATDFLFK